MFHSLKNQLQKTRKLLANGLASIFKKSSFIDVIKELEVLLLQADVGLETCAKIIAEVNNQLKLLDPKEATTPIIAREILEKVLIQILMPCERPILNQENVKPFVILLVGVNGAGKTTTIGKLANLYKNKGNKVLLACGDTFRAAAIEQLSAWGEKIKVPVIKKSINSDSAAVIFDAYNFAINNQYDILIADTAGRLHTKTNLMEELKKVSRVLKKINPAAPHEIMLVLDASIGQNSLNQFKAFNDAMNITGITLTKLDGTAKAGIIFSIANIAKVPIRFIGVGEQLTDLKEFDAKQFVSALIE